MIELHFALLDCSFPWNWLAMVGHLNRIQRENRAVFHNLINFCNLKHPCTYLQLSQLKKIYQYYINKGKIVKYCHHLRPHAQSLWTVAKFSHCCIFFYKIHNYWWLSNSVVLTEKSGGTCPIAFAVLPKIVLGLGLRLSNCCIAITQCYSDCQIPSALGLFTNSALLQNMATLGN